MKKLHRLHLSLFLSLFPALLQAEEGVLHLRVTNLEGQAVQVEIGSAITGFGVTVTGGGVRLPLPPKIQPGDRVPLKVQGDEWAIFSPWNGEVQVPPFEEKAENVALVVVGRRYQQELLRSGDVLKAITRRVLDALERLKKSQGEITEDLRRGVLVEQAAAVGLDPSEVDSALRAWRDAPISSADKALAGRYLEHYPQQILQDGSVGIEDSTLYDPVIITNPQDTSINIDQARAKFELRSPLDQLGLGMRLSLAVSASPPEALADVTCSWSLTPEGIATPPGAGPCEWEARLPVRPLPGRGKKIPVTFGVRVTRGDEVLEHLVREAVFDNGILADTLVEGEKLGAESPVVVSVVDVRNQKVLPGFYECTWELLGYPMTFSPLTENQCRGELSLKPKSEWSGPERMVFGMMRATAVVGPTIRTYLRVQGSAEPIGSVATEIHYDVPPSEPDPPSTEELAIQAHQEAGGLVSSLLQNNPDFTEGLLQGAAEAYEEQFSKILDRIQQGDPPQESSFQPLVQFMLNGWQLAFNQRELYQLTDPIEARFDDGEWSSIQASSRIDVPPQSRKVTLRTVPESGDPMGPFEFDMEKLALTAMLEKVKAKKSFLKCRNGSCEITEAGLLLAVRSVSWGIDPASLDSQLTLSHATEGFLKIVRGSSKQSFPKPLCGETLYYRLELVDGTRTAVKSAKIPRSRYEENDCLPAGSDIEDPRLLQASVPSPPVFVYSPTPKWELDEHLPLRTFSFPGIDEIRYSYIPGGPRTAAGKGSDQVFTIPFREDTERVELEFAFANGSTVGPFSYGLDPPKLQAMQALHRLGATRYLHCVRLDYSAKPRPGLPAKSTVCVQAGGLPESAWLGASRVELGVLADELDHVAPIRAEEEFVRYCFNNLDSCLFSFVLPYDTQEVFTRLRFWHGGWSDIRRFAID